MGVGVHGLGFSIQWVGGDLGFLLGRSRQGLGVWLRIQGSGMELAVQVGDRTRFHSVAARQRKSQNVPHPHPKVPHPQTLIPHPCTFNPEPSS